MTSVRPERREQFDRVVKTVRAADPLSERLTDDFGERPGYSAHLVLDGHEYVLALTPTLLEEENNRGEPLDG